MARGARFAWLITVFFAGASGCDGCEFFRGGTPDAGPRNGGVDDPCTDNTACRSGLVCSPGGTCQPSGTVQEGGVCTLSGDCVPGLYCGPRRTCVTGGDGGEGADCQSTADCEQGLYCNLEGLGGRCRATGRGDLLDSCASNIDCLAGLTCVFVGSAGACTSVQPLAGDGGVIDPPPSLPYWPGVECAIDDGPPRAYFHVPRGDATDADFFRLPYPNDVRRTATGLDLTGFPSPGTALAFDLVGRYAEAAEEDLNGFAMSPVIYFRFSRPYDWADVDGNRVMLIDLSPSSPEFGVNVGRSWFVTAGPITRYICQDWVSIRRGHGDPLRPGTTYAAILLSGIRTSEPEGHADFARDADLSALLADTMPADAALMPGWTAYQPLRDWLAQMDTPDASQVLNATVFTTHDPRARVPALRSVIRAAATAPVITDLTVCGDTTTSPCDDGGQRRCGPANAAYWEVHARISLPQFQAGTPPFEAPADGGAIALDAGGVPQVQRTEPVCMMMTIPKTSTPAGGFPVVVVAHGTGGAFTAPIADGIAEPLAQAGAATIAIDMPLHGSRRGASTRSPDVLVFNFGNPRAARDNFLQGSADLMGLIAWAEGYTLAAAGSPTTEDVRFDPSRVLMFAHSQGATHAQLILPYEDSLYAVVLSGAGGDLTESLLTKTRPVNIAAAVPLALLDMAGDGQLAVGDQHPALALLQHYFEPVDPVCFGRSVRFDPPNASSLHVFQTYGLGDSYSTERTMGAYARSVGLPHIAPRLVNINLGMPVDPPQSANVGVAGAQYTMGLRQYMPDAGEDGHFVSTQTADGRADVLRFLSTSITDAAPTIGP